MKTSVYLPDHLAQLVKKYGISISELTQNAIQKEMDKRLTGADSAELMARDRVWTLLERTISMLHTEVGRLELELQLTRVVLLRVLGFEGDAPGYSTRDLAVLATRKDVVNDD